MIQQLFSNKKVRLGSIVGIFIASLGVYYYYTKKSSSLTNNTPSTIAEQTEESFNLKLKEIIQSVKHHFDRPEFDFEAIKAICKGQYSLSQKKYKKLVWNSRLKRRLKMSDKSEYAQIVLDSQIQLEKLMDNSLNTILANFNIVKQVWMETIDNWVAKNTDNYTSWSQLIQLLQDQLLDTLRQNDKLHSFQKLSQIFKLKQQILENLNPGLIDFHLATDENSKFNLIDKYIFVRISRKRNQEEGKGQEWYSLVQHVNVESFDQRLTEKAKVSA